MCGIAGFWERERPVKANVAERMASTLAHRGPDDSGVWINQTERIAFAHRRLSVIDLSPAGRQPMSSPCGRFTLIFNGELYNHIDLRQQLQLEGIKTAWRGRSDTETLLMCLLHWGIKDTLRSSNGMFAFALWDASEKTLVLARDRMGEKPLYFGHAGSTFLFGSELKCLKVHPNWSGEIDRNALGLYFRYNYVPSPWSIYFGIYKLRPAHYLVVTDGGASVSDPHCYWSVREVAEKGVNEYIDDSKKLIDELDELLRKSVRDRMMSDVPIGMFLSGGIDSSTVAALMQAQSNRPINTFSIGFKNDEYDEAVHAKAVAAHMGSRHTELYVDPEAAISVIPKLSHIWDEPFADASQIPTLLVSKLAREQVTVSLSGDGGDELFCGYNRYVLGYRLWRALRPLPPLFRRILSVGLRSGFGRPLKWLTRQRQLRLFSPGMAEHIPKLAAVILKNSVDGYYESLVSNWEKPSDVVIGNFDLDKLAYTSDAWPDLPGLREQMMYMDSITYLPDGILTKLDRASMSVGLEARVPLLDHRLVEFSWRVPITYKLRGGRSKWILRQLLYRYIPRKIVDRPKMGFSVPVSGWLRGPLRHWAEQLIETSRLKEDGYLEPMPIQERWNEHCSGKGDWGNQLWAVLMFLAWRRSEENSG